MMTPTYFVSGSNHAGEIRGLALAGHDLGMTWALQPVR